MFIGGVLSIETSAQTFIAMLKRLISQPIVNNIWLSGDPMSCWVWAKMQMTFLTYSCFQNFIKHRNPDFLSHSGFLCQLTVILKRTSLSTQQCRVPIGPFHLCYGTEKQVGRVGRFPFFVLDVFGVHLVKFHSMILKQLGPSAEPCPGSVLRSCLGTLLWKSRVPIPRIEPGVAWWEAQTQPLGNDALSSSNMILLLPYHRLLYLNCNCYQKITRK